MSDLPATLNTDGVKVWRSPQVVQETGATYRQLDYWARLGYLYPEDEGRGSGSRRQWTAAEIRIARNIRRLIDGGFDLGTAARLADLMATRGGHAAILTDGLIITVAPNQAGAA